MIWPIALSWLFVFYENALRTSDSVIIPQLMQSLHTGAAGIGALSSSAYFAYVIFLIPAGILLDRFSLRYVLTVAIGIVAFGAFLFSISRFFWLSYVAQFIMGFGSAFAFPACVKILHEYTSPKRLSFWIGIIMTVITLGDIFGQAPWYALVQFFGSWREVYFYSSLLGVVLMLGCLCGMENISTAETSLAQEPHRRIYSLLKSRLFWIGAIFIGLLTVPVTGFIGLWAVPFVTTAWSMSTGMAATLLGLSWVGGLLGGPLLGGMADYFNARKVMLCLAGFTAVALMTAIIFYQLSFVLLGACLFLLGVVCNANVIVFAIFAENVDVASVGIITGIATVFDMGGGPIFQVIIGAMLSVMNPSAAYTVADYQSALIIIPIALFIASISMLLVKINQSHRTS